MQEEYQSAQSMQEVHHQVQVGPLHEPPFIQVLPNAAWRLHVPQGHEVPFASGHGLGLNAPRQEDAPRPAETPIPLPIRKAAPLAEYTLSSPAPAGSIVLQLVSQSGLEIGDMLLIAPGTNQQEMVQIVAFGSVILGVPLRFTHALGTPVVLAHTYATGTPAQATFIRNEAARHMPPRRHIQSHGGLTDDNDANSLEGFIDDQAWSEAEREHQKARHRRKNRQAHICPHGGKSRVSKKN